jgi:hypothetical protein
MQALDLHLCDLLLTRVDATAAAYVRPWNVASGRRTVTTEKEIVSQGTDIYSVLGNDIRIAHISAPDGRVQNVP